MLYSRRSNESAHVGIFQHKYFNQRENEGSSRRSSAGRIPTTMDRSPRTWSLRWPSGLDPHSSPDSGRTPERGRSASCSSAPGSTRWRMLRPTRPGRQLTNAAGKTPVWQSSGRLSSDPITLPPLLPDSHLPGAETPMADPGYRKQTLHVLLPFHGIESLALRLR